MALIGKSGTLYIEQLGSTVSIHQNSLYTYDIKLDLITPTFSLNPVLKLTKICHVKFIFLLKFYRINKLI